MVDNVEDEEEPARAAPKKGAKGDEEYTDIGDFKPERAPRKRRRRGAAEEEKEEAGPADEAGELLKSYKDKGKTTSVVNQGGKRGHLYQPETVEIPSFSPALEDDAEAFEVVHGRSAPNATTGVAVPLSGSLAVDNAAGNDNNDDEFDF